MRRFLKISLICGAGVIVLLASLLLALLIIVPSSVVENDFATYDAALKADAFALQRLPDLLPRSATNISSSRNLDLNDEVVTFHYGPDFDAFIAAQEQAPARTAESLGLRLRDDRFMHPGELAYMPKVLLYKESRPGTLLVNRVDRVAVYFD
ncbi:hypothetical protein [Massilia brevitalea]|uniref:hypothetical protein n=1 Tax=Massilia brevitalea TaxID=442526 RepID=UPI002739E666|nr:hypothetical protein [Massilia brevitalea]